MTKRNRFALSTLFSALLLTSYTSYAEYSEHSNNEQAHNEQSSERRGPPAAAFKACEGKNAGEAAQFNTRRGNKLTGTCEEHRGKLVLRPDNKRQDGKRRTPPAAAFSACEGKNEGELSQFENRRGKVLKGSCEVANGRLVLRPERFK